ncbi:hypothetical protein B0H14DRAFT_2554983 [Mycena olivaceomarginata]|nr:hypothetical protein B0H14DRAFT_2554983 [Mycena olivaceomarginata]
MGYGMVWDWEQSDHCAEWIWRGSGDGDGEDAGQPSELEAKQTRRRRNGVQNFSDLFSSRLPSLNTFSLQLKSGGLSLPGLRGTSSLDIRSPKEPTAREHGYPALGSLLKSIDSSLPLSNPRSLARASVRCFPGCEHSSSLTHTLEWQAGTWDRRAAAAHYSDKIVYEPVHLQGAMVFAAKQAAVRRKLAARFRQLWQHLTDRISGPDKAASSQSSGIDEDGIAGGGEETDDEYGHQSASEEEPVAGGSGDVPVARDKEEDEEDEEEDGEGRADRDADTDVRRAEMDELLAMHAPLEEL